MYSSAAPLESLADFGDHLVFARELVGLQLRIDEVTVDRQFKTPAPRWLQLELLDLLLVLREDFGRQTDGLWFVVSSSAVTQMNLHRFSPFCQRTMGYLGLTDINHDPDKPARWQVLVENRPRGSGAGPLLWVRVSGVSDL